MTFSTSIDGTLARVAFHQLDPDPGDQAREYLDSAHAMARILLSDPALADNPAVTARALAAAGNMLGASVTQGRFQTGPDTPFMIPVAGLCEHEVSVLRLANLLGFAGGVIAGGAP
jgi:hypothetical protein